VITVEAKGDSDPDLTVIDPNGDVFDANDDNGIDNSLSSLLETTLDQGGVYTLRVDAYTPGGYTITVTSGTPDPNNPPDQPTPTNFFDDGDGT